MGVAASGKPAMLCVTPHFGNSVPPAGAAALLAYLHENDCTDFGFTDFRTWLPYRCRTFNEMGAFAETFVLDVPELPIVLKMLKAFREGASTIVPERDRIFDDYCMQRLLNPAYLHQYLTTLESFFASAWKQYPDLNFAGFTTWTTNYLSTLIAAAQLKRTNPSAYVVAGGPQVTESVNSARLALEAGLFDAVVCGEGEQALLDLYQEFLSNGRTPGRARIPGVLKPKSLEATEEADGAVRKLINLKELPPPRFREMDLSSYWGWREHGMLPYQLSRGCTDKCSFCSEWVFWEKFRLTKPDLSVEQIAELQAKYSLRHISFTDSLVNGVERRLEMFAENMLSSGIDVTWGGFMRAQMTPDLAKLISRAGCRFAFVGVESLADETLDSMNKRRTGSDNVEAIEAFARAEVPVEIGLITGFPGDSRERFLETARGVMGLQSRFPGRIRVSVEAFRPTPNQPIYKDMEDYGLEPKRWDDEIIDLDPALADISGDVFCSVAGSNQGVDRLGELHYLGKVIKSGPKPSNEEFAIGWGRPEVLDFEDAYVRFRPLSGQGLRNWYSARALHPDGSVRFLIVSGDEARQLQRLMQPLGFGENPFGNAAFATAWERLAEEHAVSGSLHPDKSAMHKFKPRPDDDDLLTASPYWVARVIAQADDGLLFHSLHDLVNTYRTNPALAGPLKSADRSPMTLRELSEMAEGVDRGDVVPALEFAHELGVLSIV